MSAHVKGHKWFLRWWAVGLSICLLTACSLRRIRYHIDPLPRETRLFIALPDNPVVFENISPLLYAALYDYFSRAGYTMVHRPERAYALSVVIRNFDSIGKLISPDVQPYGFAATLTFVVILHDPAGEVCMNMTCVVRKWVYKPRNPLFLRDYLAFQYRTLCDLAPIKIDAGMRAVLVSTKDTLDD